MAYGVRTSTSQVEQETESFAEGVGILIADLAKLDPTGRSEVYDAGAGETITVSALITALAAQMFNSRMNSVEIEINEPDARIAETIWVTSNS